jgi:predicted XRE-type DNA-binding protein
MSKKGYEVGSRNVFKDLGIPNAEEHLIKAQLVFKIDSIMKSRRLKQAAAAELLGIKQPDVSNMLRGEFRQFSVERLLRFLVALDHDVEIVVKPHRGRNDAAALHVSLEQRNLVPAALLVAQGSVRKLWRRGAR